MAKIMIFIDGSWLYNNLHTLSKRFGELYKLDYGKLPMVLGDIVGEQLGHKEVDIVRTYLFGSIPQNYKIQDDYLVKRQKEFYDLLKEEYHYEIEIYPIDYKHRSIKKSDRMPDDDFTPKEKCVDISLATTMLYFAAIPYAYDIAVAVVGDRDFIPMLQHVRRLGKRVAIASIRGSCAKEYADPRDVNRLKDFDIIWIGDYLDVLELKIERRKVECGSPFHEGDKYVYTTEFIRKGQEFYCDECRKKYRKQQEELQKQQMSVLSTNQTILEEECETPYSIRCKGVIKVVLYEKGFGFIMDKKGDYFFHATDLLNEEEFQKLKEGDTVMFDADIEPNPSSSDNKNGKASKIEIISEKNGNEL